MWLVAVEVLVWHGNVSKVQIVNLCKDCALNDTLMATLNLQTYDCFRE